MAPDAPGNLVVLDVSYDRKGRLFKTVEAVEPSQSGVALGWLRVRFDEAPTKDFYPVGNGVAYVRQPDGYEHGPAGDKSEVLTLPGTGRYMFTNVAQGEGLQLILILPKGYTLSEFSPTPSNAKEFQKRIALYFRPKERFGETAKVSFGLRKIEGDVSSEAQRLRGEFLRHDGFPDNAGAYVDREDPEFTDTPLRGADNSLTTRQPLSPLTYAWIALAGLLIGVALLVFFVYQGPKLFESDTEGHVYYLLLIPWALACSAFLFGAMRSYARYTHKHLGNALELGGPVVLFCLVIVGGFKLVQEPPQTFDLTVRPYSKDGTAPIIRSGKIVLDLDNDRREANVGSSGEADFKGIPGRFLGATVRFLPIVDGYSDTPQKHKIRSHVVDLALDPAPAQLIHLMGEIVPPPQDWADLRVLVEGQQAESAVDRSGKFDLPVRAKQGEIVRIRVIGTKGVFYDDSQTLPGPVTIQLHKPH